MKKEFRISIRQLAEITARSGDLIFEFGGGMDNRAVEGIKGHQKVQGDRPDHYEKEVTVAYTYENDRFLLQLSGRVDGVFTTDDGVIVEEIKTTTRNLDYYKERENITHRAQANLYAYVYAREHGLTEIQSQLTYYQLDDEETLELPKLYTIDQLEEIAVRLMERYLEWAATLDDWRLERDLSTKELKFPFNDFRPGQRKMALAVYHCIKNSDQLFIQAPTGIGKTMGSIFPAVKAMGDDMADKLFYLTARTTGRTVAEKAFDALRGAGLRFKSLTLTAKDKICFNPDNACHPDECRFAKGYYDRLDEATRDIFQQESLTRQTIEEAAMKHTLCPFEFSLDLSLWCDAVICDFNYAFDPFVYLRRFFEEAMEEYVFLVDEAHNLVDRAREMFSAELFKQSFLEVRRGLKDDLPKIHKSMGTINNWFLVQKERFDDEGEAIADEDLPRTLLPLLGKFCSSTEKWLALNEEAPFRDELLELYFNVRRFLKISEFYGDNYATCLTRDDKDIKLKLFCLDPSDLLEIALERCAAALFFSATMTPLHYFQDLLGCDIDAKKMILPSPFPAENLCVLVADRVSTRYVHRQKTADDVASYLASLVRHKPGNYLFFFPSYHYMNMVAPLFEAQCDDIETIIQTPGMGERAREDFLDQFSADNNGALAGFAVMGGIFGEGIDLVGDRLTGAVIVGVGLPGISQERDLIKEHFNGQQQSGYEYAYIFPGINRVLQAAGRVIRSEEDRGVILLIDDRFSRHQYRSLLPVWWMPRRFTRHDDLSTLLEEFWGQ